jgi:hypothetical protein
MLKPDINNDSLVLQKEINFTIEGAPTMNFRTFQLDPFSIFHYDVQMYEKASGEQYYLFKQFDDCTLFIMNCNKDIYDILSTQLTITDDITIFDYSPGSSLEFVAIPESYRYNPGSSGMTVIFTD